VKALLFFLFVVIAASMWETKRDRPQRALPLLALCAAVAAGLFSVTRLI